MCSADGHAGRLLLLLLTETRHDKKVHCKLKYKYVTNKDEERNMTE